jgi:hypothetical protein
MNTPTLTTVPQFVGRFTTRKYPLVSGQRGRIHAKTATDVTFAIDDTFSCVEDVMVALKTFYRETYGTFASCDPKSGFGVAQWIDPDGSQVWEFFHITQVEAGVSDMEQLVTDCDTFWGSHGCHIPLDIPHTIHVCGYDSDEGPCCEYNPADGTCRYQWNDDGSWSEWMYYGPSFSMNS